MKIELQTYQRSMENQEIKTPDINITTVEVSYDGGRLNVSINGIKMMTTAMPGNDFSITIEKDIKNA